MGLFGRRTGRMPYHPQEEKQFSEKLTTQSLQEVFTDCADFSEKELVSGKGIRYQLFWVDGMIKSERLNDYIIRPLVTGPEPACPGELKQLLEGGVWNLVAQERTMLDEAVEDLIDGSVAVFFPGGQGAVTCAVPTEEKRSVESPLNENEPKGARDSFVESIRTNSSLIRRRLRDPKLKLREVTIGRRTASPVDLLWIDGVTNPQLIEALWKKLDEIDIDGLLSTGDIEEYLVDGRQTFFPQMMFTERPDKFCRGLLDGRAGLLVDGLAVACLLPGDIAQFMQTEQDRCYHWAAASALLALRYMCLVITLLLPGFYVAVASFHFEMIPTKLAISIIASKQDVPFTTPVEVVGLLIAFEILQEAGQRLPATIGQTVSIIGGLVVGQAAVDAKILSPVVVIIVAVTGITGFTMPNQDFANALRLWRLGIAILAGIGGFFGMMSGFIFLVLHLASLEHFGVAYLTPFATMPGQQVEGFAVFRQPLPEVKLRETALKPENVRKQK